MIAVCCILKSSPVTVYIALRGGNGHSDEVSEATIERVDCPSNILDTHLVVE